MDKVIKYLTELSQLETFDEDDDFSPDDLAGGNIDDAYYAGRHSGRVQVAKEILNLLTGIK